MWALLVTVLLVTTFAAEGGRAGLAASKGKHVAHSKHSGYYLRAYPGKAAGRHTVPAQRSAGTLTLPGLAAAGRQSHALHRALAESESVSPPDPLPSSSALGPVLLTGKLTQPSDHGQEERWFLYTGAEPYHTVELPGQPYASVEGYNGTMAMSLGNTISLTCELVNMGQDAYACATVTNVTAQASTIAPVQAVDRSIKVLVVNMRMCGGDHGHTADTLSDLYWGSPGYANILAACSYNKLTYDAGAFRVVDVEMPCDPRLYQDCQTRPFIRNEALNKAREILGADVLSQYEYFQMVLPPGMVSKCGFSGLAWLVADDVYLVSDPRNGVESLTTVLQEQIHNFGLYHGWSREGREYGDRTSCMGRGQACPSAPELWRLGWASSIDTLSSDNLGPGTWNTYSVPATCVSDTNHVKVTPNWLGGGYTRNLYVSVRVRANGDSRLAAEYDGKVHLHMANKDIDNNFNARGDPKVTIYDVLSPDSGRYVLADARMVLEIGSRSGDEIALAVCRYDASDSECSESVDPGGGGGGGGDPGSGGGGDPGSGGGGDPGNGGGGDPGNGGGGDPGNGGGGDPGNGGGDPGNGGGGDPGDGGGDPGNGGGGDPGNGGGGGGDVDGGNGGDNGCTNKSLWCSYWRDQGYCTARQYIAYMRKNCPATCGLCPAAARQAS